MSHTFGYRTSFGWYNPSREPQIGDTVVPGQMFYYPLITSTVSGQQFQVNLVVETKFTADDWFLGHFNHLWVTSNGNAQYHHRSYFNDCCRLSSIRDRNNDVDWTVTGILNKYSSQSPVATGLPRVYVQQFYPLQYRVPFLSPSGFPVIVSLATTTDSTLNNQVPIDQPQMPATKFALNKTTGTVSWTPQVTGLYAVAFFVEEVCTSPNDIPCADQGKVATPQKGNNGNRAVAYANCCSRVPLDFIFEVDPGCNGQPNCVPPPYFYAPFNEFTVPDVDRVWYFFRGIEGFFNVCATVNVSLAINDTQQTTHINVGTRPTTSSWAQVGPEAVSTCYLFKWAPGIADQDQYICAVAFITPGYRGNTLYNQGLYCILLKIKDGQKLQAAGIIRDFHDAHADFNVSYSDCRWCNTTFNPKASNLIYNSWVSSRLDANHKPVYAPGTPVPTSTRGSGLQIGTGEGFYDWYTTDTAVTNPRNLAIPYTVILSSGASLDQAVYTFLSSSFFPIDGQGFGNEGADHNYYYTFEVNMYVTYYGSLKLNTAANDDLWIFIDDVLPANWNQHGIKPMMPNSQPYNFTIDMDTLLDHDNNALVVNETYRCDMFYANRYGVPYLMIEVPNNTLCSQLSSGKYAINLTDFSTVPLVDGSVTNATIPANGFFYVGYSGQYGPAKGTITRPAAPYGTGQANFPGLKIFDQRSQGSAVCWGTPLKALHGFIATFTWFVNNPNKNQLDGFAFMLVSYPFYRGGAAGSLGYGGLQKSLAVEFDMLQTALLNDPDYTTCCGAYPSWATVQSGWSVKPYGEVATHAELVPNAGGSYPGNSADEGPSGGLVGTTSQGRIFLDFKNGTEYKTKIIYQPAVDDGTTNVQLGWLWTYINAQLEPVNAVQLDGVVLRNMLGGATTFCWTSGGQWVPSGSLTGANPSGYGADIWLLDLNVLIVPTDAASTAIFKAQIIGQPELVGATSPVSPMIAGQTSTVTVQARDACGNPITVGGELDLFNCTVVKQTCPGAPVACNGTDNGDGTYTFAFRPTIAASNYQLMLSFGAPGDVHTLKGSPYLFIVDAATAAIDTSIAVFGQLPELYSNAGNDPFNGDLRTEGVFAVRFTQYGRVVSPGGYKMFDFTNALDSYNGGTISGAAGLNAFIGNLQSTEYLLIGISGSKVLASLIADTTLATTMAGLSPPATQFKTVVAGNSYTYIGRKGGSAAPTCSPSCQLLSVNGTSRITTRGVDDSSISFTRNFTLVASSANDDCGPWVVLNSIFDDIRVPAGTLNQFTIQARDIFGNLNRLTNIQAAFQPDLTPSTNGDLVASSTQPLTGYFYYTFLSYKAGEFFMYASLNGDSGTNIRNGATAVAPFAPYKVIIDPGLANITNSYCQGQVLTTSTVGVWNTFQLVLYDRWQNMISFQNPADQISATLIYNVSHAVVTTLNTSWQDGPCGTKCLFYASYNTTIASSLTDNNVKFAINVTINGAWKICGTPDIVPGPFFPGTTTFDVGATGYVKAGTQTTFTIYTRDRFNNTRRTPLSSSDALYVVFQYPVTGYVLQYAGQGQYAVAVTPTKKGDNGVQVIAGGDGTGDVKPAGNQTIGTPILKVLPGPAAANSTITGVSAGIVVRAGDLNSFIVTSYDKYLNLRNNTPYGVVVANSSDYAYRFNEPTKGIEGMIQIKSGSQYATTGLFNFEYNATIIGTYRITIQTTPAPGAPTAQQIMSSPVDPVIVVPSCTHPPSTVFGGPGLGGGIQGTQTNFTMIARDIFTNVQADFRDTLLYNVTINPPTTPIPSINPGSTPGNYLVKYVVPDNTGVANLAYTITVCHNGLNSTTGPVCYPSWCTNYTAYSVNLNRFFNGTLQFTNGSAGTQMNWNILDINATGGPASGVDIVTSWLVTVTRVGDSAPASVAQPISIGTVEQLTSPTRVRTNVTFTPTVNIGTFNVHVFAYGIETEQSKAGIQVTIGPGPVYPPNCVVTGLSATVPAGSTGNKFSVALQDQWFHPITDTSLVVMTNLTHSTDLAQPMVQLTGTANGTTWNFVYSLNEKGIWDASIGETTSLLAGQGPIGNNLQVTVTPGVAVCSKSYVKGVITQPDNFATAGEAVTFNIVPIDIFGNPVEDPTTRFNITDVNGDADFSQSAVSSASPPAIEIQVTYLPRKVVLPYNTLLVQIGGCNLVGTVAVAGDPTPQNSPLNVVVYPSDIYPPYSMAVSNVATIEAGEQLSLNLTLRDRFNNSWFSDRTQAITGFVNAPGASQPFAALTTDGAGAGQYVLTLAGQNTRQASDWDGTSYVADYDWQLTANGVTISGPTNGLLSVPPSTVTAGPTSPTNTLPPTLVDITSDIPQTYQVTLRDQYGNIKYTNADNDQVQFNWIQGAILCNFNEMAQAADPSSISTVGNAVYAGNGMFNVTVLGTVVGSYTLNITVKPTYGADMTPYTGAGGWYGSPNCGPTARLLETVLPGPASPPDSWWTINKKVFNAGETATIFVQARDKRQNNIGKGGTPLSIGNMTIPTPAPTALPTAGPDTWTLNSSWTLTGRTVLTNPWVDPVFGAADPTFPIAPGSIAPSGVVTDFGNSSYAFQITFWKSGNALPLVLGMLNASNAWVAVPWPETLTNDASVDVVPGAPQQFYPNTAGVAQLLQSQGTTAAVPTSFTIHAYDKYGNPVAPDSNATFDVVLRQQTNGYVVPITADVQPGGATTFSFTSAWAGPFDLLITLHPGDGSDDITPAPAVVTIDHATCEADNPGKPYRCPDRTCVATYAQCAPTSIPANTCGLKSPPQVTCSDGSCANSASGCPCATGLCPAGNCPATAGDCPQANSCPGTFVACPGGTGQCRATLADCPSPAACPPGYVVCSSGINCGRNASDCPVPDPTLCTPPLSMCPDGSCAQTSADCPTPITCPSATPVLCLTDNSCQLDAAHCPDQYPCYAPNTYRCPGSGLCTTAMDQCPSSVTCKPGWVKCQSGTCADTLANCAAPLNCTYTKVRCADGSCVDNTLFCPAITSCATSTPVLCWDGNCVGTVGDCSTPKACPTNVTCPGGSCTNSVNLCPTGTTCPTDKPVLCADGSCQYGKDNCTIIPACPTDQPVRCPDGQSCRGSRTDCPTIVSCPIGQSVKCADGTCALALDQCAPAQNCPDGLLRCPGGECVADTTALCPTHETCPTDFGKCLDGTCRQQCPSTYQTCPKGQVTCPQASAGVQCALSLTDCPQQPTCPPGLPVRCSDASCASTVTNCPAPPTQFPNNKIPCADGTWATSIQSCPTPITCPSATPAKCTDNTCRLTPADCTVPRLCPDTTPYLCSSGACVTNPWDPDCTSSSGPCPLDKPVACAPFGSGVCEANLTVCDATVPLPLNCTSGTATCTVCGLADGQPQTFCRNGACVNSDTDCPTPLCDPSVPVKCDDGQCVADRSLCNDDATGCPSGLLRCPDTGLCTSSINQGIYDVTKGCPTNLTAGCGAGVQICNDGSCPFGTPTAICPDKNGCAAFGMDQTKKKRCYDGTCVADLADCTAAAPPADGTSSAYPAMCQPANPFKCADGFCAKTSTACPPQLVNLGCVAPNTVQCATGACVSTALMCPPLNPDCPTGWFRCSSDASCRPYNQTCPLYSTCPARCNNGICAPDMSYCDFDPFTGCPGGMNKCNMTGQCVADLATCAPLPHANGCPNTLPAKCPNGDCKATLAECNVGPSGTCPPNKPLLCGDGVCDSLCTSGQTCAAGLPERCGDGSCAASQADCHTYNGCNGTFPYRCVDGSCAKQAATSHSVDSCPLSVLCSAGLALCMDGGCVAKSSLCTPLLCVPPLVYCNFGCYDQATCNDTAGAKCPSKSPILCTSGACVANLALCGTSSTGGAANTDCTGSTPIACSQGHCVASQSDCPPYAAKANGVDIQTSAQGANANLGCGSGKIMCGDGECVDYAHRYACKIIPSCPPQTFRWWDGSCIATTSGASAEIACVNASNVRCEDGWCRDSKLGYDGCTNNKKASYLCANRNCAESPSKCNWVASGNPDTYPKFDTSCFYQFGACRRLLASSTPRPDACVPDATKQCNAMIHAGGAAELIEATVDIYKTITIPVALNSDLVSIASLTIPSGAFALTNSATTTTISIRAVPASRMRYAVNEIVPSRRSQYGSYLDFPTTVLSVPFECVLPEEIESKFVLNLTYTAWIDLTPPMIDYKDVCLARLVELKGFSSWECLIEDRFLRNLSSIFYVHKDGAPSQEVTSVFDTCAPTSSPGVVSEYNGTVFAFIFSPVPEAPASPAGLDVVQRNIVWIILGILLGIALLILLTYCAFRLFRYREKYHTEREEADRLQEEVENMKQFGGDSGNKDDQVAMTANPLAVQLKDVQARYNEEELKLQQAEASLRKQEGEIRAQHIDNMRDNRNKLAQELEKLKAQLAEAQAASQPKATFEEHNEGPTYTGDEPVREEFDTGSTAVAPKRGKKDL